MDSQNDDGPSYVPDDDDGPSYVPDDDNNNDDNNNDDNNKKVGSAENDSRIQTPPTHSQRMSSWSAAASLVLSDEDQKAKTKASRSSLPSSSITTTTTTATTKPGAVAIHQDGPSYVPDEEEDDSTSNHIMEDTLPPTSDRSLAMSVAASLVLDDDNDNEKTKAQASRSSLTNATRPGAVAVSPNSVDSDEEGRGDNPKQRHSASNRRSKRSSSSAKSETAAASAMSIKSKSQGGRSSTSSSATSPQGTSTNDDDDAVKNRVRGSSSSSTLPTMPGAMAVAGIGATAAGSEPVVRFDDDGDTTTNDLDGQRMASAASPENETGTETAILPPRDIESGNTIPVEQHPDHGSSHQPAPSPEASPPDESEQEDLPYALDAELVVEDAEELERARKQAQQEAQERLLSSAVTVEEAHVVRDDELDDKQFYRNRCKCLAIITVIIVVVIGVVVGVVVATAGNSNDGVAAPNSTCATAFGPLNQTGLVVWEGDTLERNGDFSGSCQLDYEGGFGQWYYLQGQGIRLEASTCVGSEQGGNADTQILVFAGSCSSLSCIGGGDELCGAHGAVGWLAEEQVDYFILVRGTRASSIGNFTLSISQLEDNGDCPRATPIDIPANASSSEGVSIFGSTRNQTADVQDSTFSCSLPGDASGQAAWYTTAGDDSVKCASVSVEGGFSTIVFPTTLSIFEGSCDDTQCVAGLDGGDEIAWMASAGTDYFLSVQGISSNTTGEFFLNVRSAPFNSLCTQAQTLTVNNVTGGTTVGACTVAALNCSNDEVVDGLRGVWYIVIGTGNLMVASTCENMGDDEAFTHVSQLQVFDGSNGCSPSDCIPMSYNQTTCGPDGNQRSVQWSSEEGKRYHILVQSSQPSPFSLLAGDI